MTDFFDAIGQKITPGEFVISIRDGTGAKPRMVLKFSPSKVLVSSSWYTDTSYMDACSLVVITANLGKLMTEGHQQTIDHVSQLRTKFDSQIVYDAPKTVTQPLRWVACAYTNGGPREDSPIQFVSVHQVQGTTQSALNDGTTEAADLASASDLQHSYTMDREEDLGSGYYSRLRVGGHWPYGSPSHKTGLFTHKLMTEIGLDNVELNKLIPVAVFNSMVPPTHRIEKV